jgi:hypothetical protein
MCFLDALGSLFGRDVREILVVGLGSVLERVIGGDCLGTRH